MEYRWKKALVRVWDGDPYGGGTYVGTAFFIAPGYLLTAKHVVTAVKDYQQIVLLHPFGAWDGSVDKIGGPVLHPDDQVDIAILPVNKEVSLEYCISFDLDRTVDLNTGNEVLLGGFSSKDGSVECIQVQISAYFGSYNLLVTHTSIAKGLSGGPVLYNDKVVAVVCARDEKDGTKTYLERLNSFRDFLDKYLYSRSAVRLVQPISIKDLDELKHLLGHIQISDEKVNRVFLQTVPGSRHPDNCINQSYFFTILDFLAQKKCVKPDQAPLLCFLEYLQQEIRGQVDDESSGKLSAWKEKIAGQLGMDLQAIRAKCQPLRNIITSNDNASSLLIKIEPHNLIHKDKFILTAWLYHKDRQHPDDPDPLDISEHVYQRKDLDVAVQEVLDEGFKKFGSELHV
ncbi:MAG: serine protease, partial [Candidatus Electrothrix sp. ATG2]|nr:serine protease [Candidatus Electrothrix sp. ATG2]